MALKLDMMRCFQATARDGTLASAGEALGKTPSAISMMLTQFEDRIGAPLFAGERKNRLTPLGLRVLEECDRALDAFDRSAEAIGRHARATAGTVRLAAVPSAAVSILPAAIAVFRQARPGVRLEISDLDSASVLRRLTFDEADIGIVSGQPGAAAPAGDVSGTTLLSDRLGIVCRADSPILDGPPSWALLARDGLIINPLCAHVDHPAVRELAEAGTLSARNTLTLLSFVRAGLGATVLPERALASERPGLAFVNPQDPVCERGLSLLNSTRRPPSPATAALCGALVKAAKEMADTTSANLELRY